MTRVSTHILDTSLGRPAAGVAVELSADAEAIASGVTDADGRVGELWDGVLDAGVYRLTFAVADYFRQTDREAFYPSVVIDFTVAYGEQHYHVPLLLSPFGFSTYRGS